METRSRSGRGPKKKPRKSQPSRQSRTRATASPTLVKSASLTSLERAAFENDHFSSLSLELICMVMEYLALVDVIKMESLSRRFQQAVTMHLRLILQISFTEKELTGWMPTGFTDSSFLKFLKRCPELEYIYGLHPRYLAKRRQKNGAVLSVPGVIDALCACPNLLGIETSDIFLLEAISVHLADLDIINTFQNRNGRFPIPEYNRFCLPSNIHITSLRLTGVVIPELPEMDCVQYIYLKWVKLTDPQPFQNFVTPMLRTFVMNNCAGPQNALKYVPLVTALATARSLTRLELVRVPFLGGLFQHVVEDRWRAQGFRSLQKIVIGACKHVLEVDLGYLMITCCSKLEELALQPSLTKDSFFASLILAEVDFPLLDTLHLGYVDSFPEEGKWKNEELVKHGLADIVENPANLTDVGMASVSRVFLGCRSLSLYNCPHVHKPTLWLAPGQMVWTRLRDLHLQRCHALRLDDFCRVLPCLPALETLYLEQMFREPPRGCSRVGLSAGTGLGVSAALVSNTGNDAHQPAVNQNAANNNMPAGLGDNNAADESDTDDEDDDAPAPEGDNVVVGNGDAEPEAALHPGDDNEEPQVPANRVDNAVEASSSRERVDDRRESAVSDGGEHSGRPVADHVSRTEPSSSVRRSPVSDKEDTLPDVDSASPVRDVDMCHDGGTGAGTSGLADISNASVGVRSAGVAVTHNHCLQKTQENEKSRDAVIKKQNVPPDENVPPVRSSAACDDLATNNKDNSVDKDLGKYEMEHGESMELAHTDKSDSPSDDSNGRLSKLDGSSRNSGQSGVHEPGCSKSSSESCDQIPVKKTESPNIASEGSVGVEVASRRPSCDSFTSGSEIGGTVDGTECSASGTAAGGSKNGADESELMDIDADFQVETQSSVVNTFDGSQTKNAASSGGLENSTAVRDNAESNDHESCDVEMGDTPSCSGTQDKDKSAENENEGTSREQIACEKRTCHYCGRTIAETEVEQSADGCRSPKRRRVDREKVTPKIGKSWTGKKKGLVKKPRDEDPPSQVNQSCQAVSEEIRESTKKAKEDLEKNSEPTSPTDQPNTGANADATSPASADKGQGEGDGKKASVREKASVPEGMDEGGDPVDLDGETDGAGVRRLYRKKVPMVNKATSTSDPVLEDDIVQLLTIRSATLVSLTLHQVGVTDLIIKGCSKLQMLSGTHCRVLKNICMQDVPKLRRVSFAQCGKLRHRDLVDEVLSQPAEDHKLIILRPMQKYEPDAMARLLLQIGRYDYHTCLVHDYSLDPTATQYNKVRLSCWLNVFGQINAALLESDRVKAANPMFTSRGTYYWYEDFYQMQGKSSNGADWEVLTDLPWLKTLSALERYPGSTSLLPDDTKIGLYNPETRGHTYDARLEKEIELDIAEVVERDRGIYKYIAAVYINMCDMDGVPKADLYL